MKLDKYKKILENTSERTKETVKEAMYYLDRMNKELYQVEKESYIKYLQEHPELERTGDGGMGERYWDGEKCVAWRKHGFAFNTYYLYGGTNEETNTFVTEIFNNKSK